MLTRNRGQIIALHAAYTYPGAQFYPGCHQVNVSGGGSTTPTGLVSIPGAYKATDPGITYDAYKCKLCCTYCSHFDFETDVLKPKHTSFPVRMSSRARKLHMFFDATVMLIQ